MAENIVTNDLEAEIAELSRQIENKKRELETENGIVREGLISATGKEVVAETVAEHFYGNNSSATTSDNDNDNSPVNPSPVKPTVVGKDYLDTLPPETVEAVNTYVAMVPKDGIRKTITRVQTEQPFIIDAFHDALVTRLYDELKQRGIVK